MIKTVDDEEKISSPIHYRGQLLTKDGLYEVLMQSRKPIAKAFKKEVKAILKSSLRDGGYIVTNEEDDDATIMAKALLVAQKTIDRQNKKQEEEHKKIEEDRPKVLLIEKIISTNV